ncbi:hypothetical protein PNP59_14210 [Halobacterium salinarum]|nr:hypothetical protein [Halobacterium salinarum]MDL0132058.1 hypothetical protein [Halobacterium salinarum]
MSREQYGDSLDLDNYREAVNDAREDLGMDMDHRSDRSNSETTTENQNDDVSVDEDGVTKEATVEEAEIAAAVANARFEE